MAGRPREFNKTTALRKMREVFWKKGFEATTMIDLIDATGVASASLYSTFGTKADMFREAILDYNANEGGFASRALKEEPSSRTAIVRMLKDAAMLFTSWDRPRGCMIVSLGLRMGAESDDLVAWLSEQRKQRVTSVLERLRLGQDAGEIRRSTDVVALADFITTVLQGLSVQAEDGMPRERLLAVVNQTLQYYDRVTSLDN
ncbi:TetR/AcrR family transcriptional regulator [Sinorhizobium sp. 7-81]|uniref:TetR/AcrR family transcriptional regulator n=1 Tax=Sinorhizobium sp. 8-89 TaxID=3049089 RepID=UPI0024C3EA01|nr:TetR/AcrR family transcriptional regulator [Sinorhizobium sp. 8-89]MDK1494582.1 TetR/AcrR family transcriptional regulator [Sinorhizobium sp. 8-89]